MDGKMLARLGAIVFVAFAITATVIGMMRKEEPPPYRAVVPAEPAHDPLRAGQRRCQQLGQAAAEDADCLAVWAKTRDRFLGRPSSPSSAPSGMNEGR